MSETDSKVGSDPLAGLAGTPAKGPETGTVTILFTDLEGSTDLRLRVGDTVANEVIKAHDDLVRSCLENAGGARLKSLGDGFMALFNSAKQAIDAAISIQQAVEQRNLSNPDLPISVRIGLNSGDVTQSMTDAHGTAVHAASRIANKAQGGQILISQLVHDLAGTLSSARIVDRGLFWLKGFPERWRLFEILWREKDHGDRVTRETRAVSAAAFDINTPRTTAPVVGRSRELGIIAEQLASPGGLRAVVIEGEAGIGKTRMLDATADLAAHLESPYWVLDVAADEELRGPFLLFRSLLNSPRTGAIAQQAMALEALDRAQEAVGGSGARAEGLSPQEKMLRTFDEVTSAFLALTRERPLALLFDDVQWADDDSIQLIRYLVRTLASGPIFLLISLRPHSDSISGGAGKLIADLDRMRVTQVLRLQRLTRLQTAELLKGLLGAPVDDATVASFHARSEGVPFFAEELARAYREAEALQLIDGTWTMTKLSGPAVPSSIQSLIERRLAQLPEDCRALLADAGVLGRRFGLGDLARMLARVQGEQERPEWQLGETLQRAVDLGLLVEEPAGSRYDFSFSHDQIRAALLGSISRQRKRAIHGAIAETMAATGGSENLSMLAHHALRAGDQALAMSSALAAARAAMDVSAPEEAVRLIDAALTAASNPEDRITMLRVKDDALQVLDRGTDRLANLAEMGALAAAFPEIDSEVRLRRASAARANQDFEMAVDLALGVCQAAVDSSDRRLELAARLELGQALTRAPIGEGYMTLVEVDLDTAESAFRTALGIAREIGARSEEADAIRELAVIEAGRVKRAAIAAEESGTSRIEILMQAPVMFGKTKELAEEAFKIYEGLGDKRGSMSALILMAYAHVTDPTATGMAGRMEHIRALHHNRSGEITESQRAKDDSLMLYSIHTYARTNLQPGLALERGREAFDAARALGDRWLEGLVAGGMAMTHLSVGDELQCVAWLERAAGAAVSVASGSMTRRLEMWRGAHAAARNDLGGTVAHFERAAELAGLKNLGGRCQALSTMAFECARIGVTTGEQAALEKGKLAATETLATVDSMSGQLPWESEAHAALALVAQATGDLKTAAVEARACLQLDGETFLEQYLHALWAAGRILIVNNEPEAASLSAEVIAALGFVDMSISDPDFKLRWFALPMVRELAEIVGYESSTAEESESTELTDEDLVLLRDMASGSLAPQETGGVDVLLAKLGVASQAEALEYAIKAGVSWQ
ncbi:MAG TPA: AAA family ATPase [Acidimicrobiia bacterium]